MSTVLLVEYTHILTKKASLEISTIIAKSKIPQIGKEIDRTYKSLYEKHGCINTAAIAEARPCFERASIIAREIIDIIIAQLDANNEAKRAINSVISSGRTFDGKPLTKEMIEDQKSMIKGINKSNEQLNFLIEDLSKPAELPDQSEEILIEAGNAYVNFFKSCEALKC